MRTISKLSLALLTLTGCGSDVCEQAASKQRSCIQAMDCSKTDPLEKSTCEQRQQSLLQAAELPDVACRDVIKARAEEILSCDLDPQTCVCPR